MHSSFVRLVGHRPDQPNRILLRDEEGRYLLRSACGSRPVRITARDAERLMREYRYQLIDDGDWVPAIGISELGCLLPEPDATLDQVQH